VRNGGRVGLIGSISNTFTGDVFIDNAGMSLRKKNGAIAIKSNIFVRNYGELTLDLGNQIAKSSRVLLQDSFFNFFNSDYKNIPNEQSLRLMAIEGYSVIQFAQYKYRQALFLDDLFVDSDALLTLNGWRDGFHFLLVRKDSEHLDDALSRIKFEGRREPKASLRDYDKDYWQVIPGFPEPSTYGALFGGLSLGLVALRRRRTGNAAHITTRWWKA